MAPVLKPIWSATAAAVKDSQNGQSVTALAENGQVFVLQKNNKLAALNAATGKKLWEFGTGLAPLFTYSNGHVYGLTAGGSLYAVTETGQKVWSAAVSYPKADSIQRIGNTVYVTQGEQLAALNAGNGKLKWKIGEDSNIYTGLTNLVESDGIIIRNYISQGAISSRAIVAYDGQTGKKLWLHSRQGLPLVIKDGLVYSETDLAMLDDDPVNRKVKVSVFTLKTGVLKGERLYRWTDSENKDGVFRSGGVHGSAFLDGKDFYVFQGKQLAKYDFWSYKAEGQPVQTWEQAAIQENEYPLNRVAEGRMFYYDNERGSLTALKLATGQVVRFNMGENP